MDWTLVNFIFSIVGPAILFVLCILLAVEVNALVGWVVKKWRQRRGR